MDTRIEVLLCTSEYTLSDELSVTRGNIYSIFENERGYKYIVDNEGTVHYISTIENEECLVKL